MTLEGAESLLRMLGFLVVMVPVSVVASWVLGCRTTRRFMIKWMHLYGPPELKRKHLVLLTRIEWRDRKIRRLEAREKQHLEIIRSGQVALSRTAIERLEDDT